MACGAFPIVSDIPANRQWVRDRENGMIVSGADARSLADAIAEAAEDEALRRRAESRNLEIVRARGDRSRNIAALSTRLEALFSADPEPVRTRPPD